MSAQITTPPPSTGWLSPADCRLDDLRSLVERVTRSADYPTADRVQDNIPVYGKRASWRSGTAAGRRGLQVELADALLDGPGVVVFRRAFPDPAVIDHATAAFTALIDEQPDDEQPTGEGHAGEQHDDGDQLWGALEKLALGYPEVFADYYANDVVNLVSVAWLGPNYQVTSTLKLVSPGGPAQTSHRDYHLGFMSLDHAGQYPAQAHRLSPVLTLQAMVAHCDMPAATGPTRYLPHSQKYQPGYLAAGLPEFQAYFEHNHVQLPLAKGDVVFINPALLHAGGPNLTSDVLRMSNLLQISSAFGRPQETVDRQRICLALYPALLALKRSGARARTLGNIIAAAAEGYPYPTNLDRDRPAGGLHPQTQAELLGQALTAEWDPATLESRLGAQAERRQSGRAR
jgi:ectoine hydroxylase-related dioxygenase (phytanoyl-CoA dioxygenase family)